jgi:hypothetical protein
MSGIEKFKQQGFKISIPKENQIDFLQGENKETQTRISFYLDKEDIGTNCYYTSQAKEINKAVVKFQKELNWENIKEINFW